MEEFKKHINFELSRRRFLKRTSLGLGTMALSGLLNTGKALAKPHTDNNGILKGGHFPAKAKRRFPVL